MVREQSIESFYARLRESALASSFSTPLLIFPSTSDVDSLCALKIVGHVLESDSVRYACYPVSTFKEIHKYAGPNLSSSSDEPVTILLINWGCHRDLRKSLNLGPSARVFVVDSHRPIHLHNLSDQNDRVVVLYTRDDEQQADLAYDFDVSALANASDLISDDDVEDDSDSDDENESESEEEEDGGGTRKKRRVSEESETDPVKLFRKLKKEYYYMGTFHGKPSGCLMYDLSHYLRKNTNQLLWLACVALTDQFVHERLTNERYQAGVMELEQHINSSGNLDVVTTVTLKDGTKVLAPDSSRIAFEHEPELMLLQRVELV
uniref:Cell division control protein 45 n=1 Tax=Davidia involucrata TaxID=16924 RepID=A0A5B6YZP3_DAVIN